VAQVARVMYDAKPVAAGRRYRPAHGLRLPQERQARPDPVDRVEAGPERLRGHGPCLSQPRSSVPPCVRRRRSVTSPDGRFWWNSPPVWPSPPVGWTPVDGWAPDPSWPPAPEGWQFWLPTEPPAGADSDSDSAVDQGPDVRADPDKLDLRLSLNPRVALARSRHNNQVNARKKALRRQDATPSPPAVVEIHAEVSAREREVEPAPAKPRRSLTERRAERGAAQHVKDVAKQAEKDAAAALQARQNLLAQRASLQEQLDFVAGWPDSAPTSSGLVLKKGEHMVGTVQPAGLVEVRRPRGHVVGASTGVSVRIAKGVRIRAGASRGHYVPGDEQETQLDSGSAAITNQRIVFSGSRQTREWKFENLIGRQLFGNKQMSWLELPVSNRQKMSALSFPKAQADAVVSAVELALLFNQGDQGALIEELRRQLSGLTD